MISFPNAKINLGLSILKKRSDGFHDIESCFYPVQWCDALEILPSGETKFTSSGIEIPGEAEGNLCLKVYAALKEKYKLPLVHIHLHKNIPIGAGMGGGSSDAAFTIKMLNELFHLKLSTTEMESYLRPLGSDCAFFVQNKPTIAIEKGDVFQSTALSLKGYHITIVYPALHISTKEAYSGVVPAVPALSTEAILAKTPTEWKGLLENDFEKSLFGKYALLAEIKEKLYGMGATYASMTGSGSAVYGIFKQKTENKQHFSADYKIWEGVLD